jgi:2-polyprenyl-6-methoxyphenol hydroxylase-like FAD-dependent oxidoreductase
MGGSGPANCTISEGGTGHVEFVCHKQPILEKHLRLAAAATKCLQLRIGCTATSIVELNDCVKVSYQRHGGDTRRVRGRYLVGSDGKTSFTKRSTWSLEAY